MELAGSAEKTAFRRYAELSAPRNISLLAESSRKEGFLMASQECHLDISLRDCGPGTRSRPAPEAAPEAPAGNESAPVPAPRTPSGRGDGGGGHGDGNTPSTRRSVRRIQGCGRCGGDPLPPSAPDFDDLVRRKVADAMRDMVCSHAENGNGALSRLLHNETQEDSRSSLPGAVAEPEVDAVGQRWARIWGVVEDDKG